MSGEGTLFKVGGMPRWNGAGVSRCNSCMNFFRFLYAFSCVQNKNLLVLLPFMTSLKPSAPGTKWKTPFKWIRCTDVRSLTDACVNGPYFLGHECCILFIYQQRHILRHASNPVFLGTGHINDETSRPSGISVCVHI